MLKLDIMDIHKNVQAIINKNMDISNYIITASFDRILLYFRVNLINNDK